MNKNMLLLKMFLLLAIPVFTFIYLSNHFGTMLSASTGLVALMVLSILLFARKPKGNTEKR
ncbi:hypothetical protein P4T04_04425 [Bacillus badius]|uniref:hypothetical protein n=1 Tax=Bacillus badius TaxID=1455 RepID=UPI002E1C4AE4|nr:hypothetical protein [Bacillus badius]